MYEFFEKDHQTSSTTDPIDFALNNDEKEIFKKCIFSKKFRATLNLLNNPKKPNDEVNTIYDEKRINDPTLNDTVDISDSPETKKCINIHFTNLRVFCLVSIKIQII